MKANEGLHLCQCGCGEPVRLRVEHFPTPPRFIHGHNPRKAPRPVMPGPPCACGCGELVKEGNRFVNGHNRRGRPQPTAARAAISKAMSGERNHRHGKKPAQWRGWTISPGGYRMMWSPEHPYAVGTGYVMEHRLVVEADLVANNPESEFLADEGGRLVLRRDLHVHHLDEDKLNNDRANLEVLTKAEHTALHSKGNTYAAKKEG